MTYRNDVFGFDQDRPAEPEGAPPGGAGREPSRTRRHDPDEELGWGAQGPAPSWASSRQEQWIREHGGREHGGFSNYAGGGDRDRFLREREVPIHRQIGPHMERWHRGGPPRDEGWYAATTSRPEMESWYAAAGEAPPRGVYGPRHLGYGAPRGMTARELDVREREWGPMFGRLAGWAESPYGEQLDELRRAGIESPFADLERGPYYGKGPKGYKRSDERIREEVCDAIARQGWIDATDVDVSVEGGIVRLSGTVRRSRDRRALEALVERVLGVDEVRNELRLERDETSPTLGGARPEQRTQAPSELPEDGRSART